MLLRSPPAAGGSARPRRVVACTVFSTLLMLSILGNCAAPLQHLMSQSLTAAGLSSQGQAVAGGHAECGIGPFHVDSPVLKDGEKQLCQTYNRVCFDQGTLVSYDPAYSPGNATSQRIPVLDITALEYAWAGGGGNGDVYHNWLFKYEPLAFRPNASLEASPDLRTPSFSNCTVAVLYTQYINNYEEVISRVSARLWQLWEDGGMGSSPLLVMGTPSGQDMHPYIPFLLGAFTPLPVYTFAELSARRAPHPYGRCFQTAHLCAFTDMGHFPGVRGAMQALYTHYEPELLPPQPEARFKGGDDVLKVLLEHRTGPSRNILNYKQLLEECNAFQGWQLDQRGPFKRVECRHATFTSDSRANLAAVRPADILVSVHGSGCVNWMAMREGSALLELRPFEFGSKAREWADWFYPWMAQDTGQKVHWYALNVEDPALSTPTDREVAGIDPEELKGQETAMRDRHTTLPFPALRKMIERMGASVGDHERYFEHQAANAQYVELRPGGELKSVHELSPPPPPEQAAEQAAEQAPP